MANWVLIVAVLIIILIGIYFWRQQQQKQQAQQLLQSVQQRLGTVGTAAAAAAGAAAGAAAAGAGPTAGPSAGPPGVAKQRRVVDVSDQELQAYLQDPNRPSVVLFYSPACGHCKQMMGAYDQYGQLAGPKVHVLRIDCSRFYNVAEQQRIDGFPTIKLFQNGQATKEYTGDRKVGSFMVFQSGN